MLSPTTLTAWFPFPSPSRPLPAAPEALRMSSLPNPGSRRRSRTAAVLAAALACVAFGTLPGPAGCSRQPRPLALGELDGQERTYVTRVIVLERVKAAMLVDGRRGATLGDSLLVAWGDSARERTADMAPAEPTRAVRVHDLLLRLLAAEQDSLLRHGGLRPLDAPLPAPADSVPGTGFPAASRVRADGE